MSRRLLYWANRLADGPYCRDAPEQGFCRLWGFSGGKSRRLKAFRTRAQSIAACLVIAAGVTVIAAVSNEVRGQEEASAQSDPLETPAALFPTDRAVVQRLNQARELLKAKRFSEAVRLLASIQVSPQDSFFQPDKQVPVYRSVAAEASDLLAALPRAGREAYELEFGAEAAAALRDATSRGDSAVVADVARRFLHSHAGQQAALISALEYLDRGQPLAAACRLERLRQVVEPNDAWEPGLTLALATSWLQAGEEPRAGERLAELPDRCLGGECVLGGVKSRLPGNRAGLLPWLKRTLGTVALAPVHADEDTPAEGDADHSAGPPLLVARWKSRSSSDPDAGRAIDQLGAAFREQGLCALPAWTPLVVGQRVISRTVFGLHALDMATGKRLWEAAPSQQSQRVEDYGGGWARNLASPQMTLGLELRVWDDSTFGKLSTDGRLVFSVEDLSMGNLPNVPAAMMLANMRRRMGPTAPKAENRLAAYEVETGKLLWELGGPEGDDALPLAGHFFLGAPLPLAGSVYALAERAGEIRLIAIEGASGKLEWAQQLVMVENGVLQDPLRRFGGLSPAYADGVLVCPTAEGAVVAVDLANRILLWGYQYPTANLPGQEIFGGMGPNVVFAAGRMTSRGPGSPSDRWLDATVAIAGKRVLLTPPASNELHCLDLVDGRVLWKAPRGDGLFLAGIDGDRVLVVGRGRVRALGIEAGNELWPSPTGELPAGVLPSGRGFFGSGRYYLPLSSAEIAAIECASGAIERRARSRVGEVAGNLVSYRGRVLSQAAEGVASFSQLDALEREVAERLRRSPDDPLALARQGELLWEQGKLTDAVMVLRKSYSAQGDEHVRQMLFDALRAQLTEDFAGNRERAGELEQLARTTRERASSLRVVARGLEQSGDVVGAIGSLLRLGEPDLGPPELETIEPHWKVRSDRWVRGRLRALVERATEAQRREIDERLRAPMAAAEAEANGDVLARLDQFFGWGPWSERAARLQLHESNGPGALAMELALRRLEHSGDRKIAGEAAARMAELLARQARPVEGAIACRRLLAGWENDVVLDGKIGRQMVDELSALPGLKQALDPSDRWPRGRVEVKKAAGPQPSYVRQGLWIRGSSDPYFEDVVFEWDQARPGQPLVALDGQGRELWQAPLIDLSQRIGFEYTPGFNHVLLNGHLLLLSIGRRVLAIDAFASSEGKPRRVLWSKETLEGPGALAATQMVQIQGTSLDWGGERYTATDGLNQPLGLLGPATEDYVLIPRQRSIEALDPLRGETLWQRTGLPPGCECFGDEELIFAAPQEGEEAIVLSAVDGELLGRRAIPPAAERVRLQGRHVLAWTPQADGARLVRWIDVWTGKEIWRRVVAQGSKAALLGSEAMAVAEPGGTFLLLELADGHPRIETQLDAVPGLSEVLLLPGRDTLVVVLNRPEDEPTIWLRPIPNGPDNRVVHGRVVGFDRASGEKLWTHEVERQGVLMRQPSELPMLTFLCHIYERPAAGPMRNQNHVAILCLDRRTGRSIYQDRLPAGVTNYALETNTEQRTISIRLLRETITLAFTGEPWPEGEAAPADSGKKDDDSAAASDEASDEEGSETNEEPAPDAPDTAAPRPDAAEAPENAPSPGSAENNDAAPAPEAASGGDP